MGGPAGRQGPHPESYHCARGEADETPQEARGQVGGAGVGTPPPRGDGSPAVTMSWQEGLRIPWLVKCRRAFVELWLPRGPCLQISGPGAGRGAQVSHAVSPWF